MPASAQGSQWPRVGYSALQTADPLYPTAAQEAGLCGEGGKAAAGADTAAGGLREEGTDGAPAAHTPGARAGLAEDAAGEDRVIWAGPQHGAFGVDFNRDGHLHPCQVPLCFWIQVVGLSS